ncbi:PAS domain S-box protein [Bradyrhizobium sp. 180]|uniref:PAS domain-containing sensor histidine kinase n=1 Tax=unclassified Bradyrhizobium TaxID=2631580 RepID=UPI001FFA6829|nr:MULTISPECIES: PAS domain-containing sensor histidine kinase [unclassified Bradyrhizobium]MCK1419274.1 PAS domain S-box protein [Bradyrhizobium sp. CW12]MCK1494493.1 PAS domain S-box protein [Bradyrhizobium sp. 180]MCK1526935.1 PAS domain S-box protein [Bradyrhizobium sp. 182]MCK1595359.1 PAS domain S-box protein [Bradyrhizobium sp. 164]MCK1645277.1 PAS domain S-box protein [Bradyrhizobium sp. 154]
MVKKSSQQRDLFESERSFRLLVEGVADYALYMLDPSGIITSWNIGGERIKGYSPGEILGQHFSRFYTETDRANGKPARALGIAREKGRYEEEGWRVRKDGTFFWASVVIDPIYEDGELVGFAKITRDITERRNTQLKLEVMQKQLAESQKFDALGQLTGGVAHDFNNLLMIISGSLHMLKRGTDDEAKVQRAISAIETATKRGAALTNQLLTFARRQSVNPQAVDFAERIAAIREVLDAGVGSSVRLVFDISGEVWPIKTDVSELETALLNLVINARDAMPDGGTVTIGAHNVVLHEPTLAGNFVAIDVSDTGFGIPDDVLDKIFEPFFTTKPIGKGTGLGLSQVHGFAHQAGGTIKVASELGKGTTFTILLPRADDAPSREPAGASSFRGSGTVLLVEDNPDVASVSVGLLEQLGYSVRRVADAEAALLEIEKNGVDFVFSDIVMPGKMDGLGLAQHLRQIRPGLPILLATGYSEVAAGVRGDFPILRKPYEIHELSEAIAKLPR